MEDFEAIVKEKKQLTHDVIELTTTAPQGFSYIPGQYMMFRIEREEVRMRAYSILDSSEGELKFMIKLIPGGFAAGKFEEMQVGDKIKMKGPLGHLMFNDKQNEQWFIGCGCGLAPLYRILKTELPRNPDKRFFLLFSVRKKEDLVYHQELLDWQESYPNFTYMPTLTREEWEGLQGRVQNHLPENLQNKTFYICGLKELVASNKDLLLERGVSLENVKFERYT